MLNPYNIMIFFVNPSHKSYYALNYCTISHTCPQCQIRHARTKLDASSGEWNLIRDSLMIFRNVKHASMQINNSNE